MVYQIRRWRDGNNKVGCAAGGTSVGSVDSVANKGGAEGPESSGDAERLHRMVMVGVGVVFAANPNFCSIRVSVFPMAAFPCMIFKPCGF